MTYQPHSDPIKLLTQFNPIKQIASKYHQQFAKLLQLIHLAPGDCIIRKSGSNQDQHFLVDGRVEIRESFEKRYQFSHLDKQCQRSLQSQIAKRSSVKAIEHSILLVADNEQIEQYLSWSQGYAIFHLDDGDISIGADQPIDDNYQQDWDTAFVSSPLAANMSNYAIHHLLSKLEDISVKRGDVIVKAHSPGDFFYIVKIGDAEVQTAQSGPYQGQNFQLMSGDYFGDEALVAGTPRNATVTMTSDGILGRLDRESFEQLIKLHLVSPVTDMAKIQGSNIEILDVRFPIEFKQGHQAGSTNLPISCLRKQLQQLSQSVQYVITPANDRRAELATYLMRQAGFQAYHLAVQS